MEGIRVQVCAEGGECSLCGVAGATQPGEWESVDCPGDGIRGGRVQLTQANNTLQFCEIEIFGTGNVHTIYER